MTVRDQSNQKRPNEQLRPGSFQTNWPCNSDELFDRLHGRLPGEMRTMRDLLVSALWRSPDHWEMVSDPT